MKRIFIKLCMYFCLFMIVGGLFTVPKMMAISTSNSQTISLFIPFVIFGFGFIKSYSYAKTKGYLEKKKEKNDTIINKQVNQNVFDNKKEENKNIEITPDLETFTQSQKNLINVEFGHDLLFDEEYLNIVLDDGKTIKEHMREDYNEVLNNTNDNIDDLDENEKYIELFSKLNADDYIKTLEKRMIINQEKKLLHPDQVIKMYEDGIAAYYELKKYCYSFEKYGKAYFKKTWQHLHNSKEKDFDFVNQLKNYLESYKNDYDKHLKEYNKTLEILKRVSNPLEEKIKRHYDPDAWYIRLGNRINIYTNDTNTYISLAGQKCVEFEETLLEYADDFKNSVCPYCKGKIELPKQRKKCPLCKQKIHIVKGGIKQGMMVLKEEDKIKLYQLREDFKVDKKYNPNYGHGIVVEDSTNLIESTKKEL